MSNVIGFLEKLGRDAQLRHAGSAEIELALASAEIEPALRAAILGHDPQQLAALLGATSSVCCLIERPDEEEEEDDEDDDDDDDDDDDEEEEEDVKQPRGHTSGRAAAS